MLSAAELARRSGISNDRVDRFVELGLLEAERGRFQPSDVQRVIEAVERAGISPEDLSRLIADGWFSFDAADVLFPDPVPLTGQNLADVSEDLGLPLSLARRALTAWAVPLPDPTDPVRADDRAILTVVAEAYEALGHDEDSTIARSATSARTCGGSPSPKCGGFAARSWRRASPKVLSK